MESIYKARAWHRRSGQVLASPCGDAATVVTGVSREAFFDPAQDALTVQLAPRNQLGNANALYGLARSATRIGGPLAAAFGTSAVFALGAVCGLASSAVVLSLRSVRAVRWRGGDESQDESRDEPAVSASAPPREARRRRLAAPPP